MEILVLGMLEVRHDGTSVGPHGLGGRKPKQLLQILVASRGHQVPKERLVELLWEGHPPRHPMAALENHVWVLRTSLRGAVPDREPVVVAEFGAYRLAGERVTLDIDRFDRLVDDAGRRGLVAGRGQLEEALALVRGEAFEDEPYAEWAGPVRELYRARVQRLLLDAAEAALLAGDPWAAATRAAEAMERDALSERACQLRMRGLAEQHERGEAMRVFESFRSRLAAELGIEPLVETAAIREQIRTGAYRRRHALPREAPGTAT